MNSLSWIAGIILIALSVSAGAETRGSSAPCQDWEGQWQETRIFFGLSKSGGNAISRRSVDAFVEEILVETFPYGFTLIETTGYWHDRDARETSYENGLQVVLLHEATPENEARIDEVARHYRERFEQQSVLIANSPARVRSCDG